MVKIGIIGGSGFYAMEKVTEVGELNVDTPFGACTGPIKHLKYGEHDIYFLARHGPGHVVPPSDLPHRAHIHAFKQLGVTRILAITAVGSLKEDRRPGDIVLVDQYFDRLKQNYTFYDQGLAVHVPLGDPACSTWREHVFAAAKTECDKAGVRSFNGGTYVCMEGPAFSTRAESNFYRSLDASVIGMTSLPEAKLSREAEICYVALALVTDYDCWHTAEDVTAGAVVEQMKRNVAVAMATIVTLLDSLDSVPECAVGCTTALAGAVMTPRAKIDDAIFEKVKLFIGKHVGEK